MTQARLNPVAILVSAFAHQALGALWYGALFAAPWMKLVNKPLEELQAVGGIAYAIAFLAALAMATAIAILFRRAGTATAAEGAIIGFLLGAALIMAPWITNGVFEARPLALSLIDSGYPVIGLT
ncbi:MAG: DUF1761 domain-containing protein, partial [Thermoanaerobaculia bacterium]